MLTLLFSALRRVWWIIPIAAALTYGTWERHEATVAKDRAAQLQLHLAQQQATVAQLRAGIAAQNAGIERILQQGAANVAAAKAQASAEALAAEKVRVVYRTRVQTIKAAQVPQQCASAAAWAAAQAEQLIKGWK